MSEDAKKTEAEEEKKEGAEGEAAAAAEGDAKAKKKKKLIIIAAAGLAFLLLAGGGAAFFLLGQKKHAEEEEQAHAAAAAAKDEHAKPVYYALGDMIVNLSGEGRKPNFLKVKVSLELADEKDLPAMDPIKPRIIDNFQVYLRELRLEDLRGSAGMYRLREELLMRVTEAAQPVRVRDVLFQEMLVQ